MVTPSPFLEAQPRLGGQILLAAQGGWRKYKITRLGVEIRLDSYADAQDIHALAPDLVITATGSIPADHLALSLSTVWDALSGQFLPEGETVI